MVVLSKLLEGQEIPEPSKYAMKVALARDSDFAFL